MKRLVAQRLLAAFLGLLALAPASPAASRGIGWLLHALACDCADCGDAAAESASEATATSPAPHGCCTPESAATTTSREQDRNGPNVGPDSGMCSDGCGCTTAPAPADPRPPAERPGTDADGSSVARRLAVSAQVSARTPFAATGLCALPTRFEPEARTDPPGAGIRAARPSGHELRRHLATLCTALL